MPLHHATIAKAAKLGVILTTVANSDRVEALWPDRNKRGYVANAGQAPGLVDDMRVLRMITLEYPSLKVSQPSIKKDDYTWIITLRGDVIGSGARLNDAWQSALDILEGPADDESDEENDEDDALDEMDKVAAGEDPESDEDEEPDEGKSKIKRKYKTQYKPFKNTNGDDIAQQLSSYLKTVKDPDSKRLKIDPARLERFARANGIWSDEYKKLNMGMQRLNVGNRLRGVISKNPDYQIVWAK